MKMILVLLAVTSLLGLASMGHAQSTVAMDPQALVGQWDGTWKTAETDGGSYLTIEKVEGGKVYGTATSTGSRPGTNFSNVKVEGEITPQGFTTTRGTVYTLTGDTLTGRTTTRAEISLTRQKK